MQRFGNTRAGQQPSLRRFCIPLAGCIIAKHHKKNQWVVWRMEALISLIFYLPQDVETPSAISDIVERIKATWEQDSWASTMVYWPSGEADTVWQRLPISADRMETGESVKYNQVDSDELTCWKIERFSNQPKDLISTTFFSFVRIHWKV